MNRFAGSHKLKSMLIVSGVSAGMLIGINIYKGNEKFYDKVLLPIAQLLPPETSHKLAVYACKYNFFPKIKYNDPASLETNFFGFTLSNPIGIAAGFDKQGEIVDGLYEMGFSFIEVGSVTPVPQVGNPKPRVFRLPEDKAIINRYGFNSDGHKKVYERLNDLKNKKNFKGVVGVNLGKNKMSENALEDYVLGIKTFGLIADYLVINVSSPNTPGLRDLQHKTEMEKLLIGVIKARNSLETLSKPAILLKLAPDLSDIERKEIADVLKKSDCKVDGLIISNTTIQRNNLKNEINCTEAGGLSGAPLGAMSTKMISDMYKLTDGKIPIIGVGGIFSGKDAYEKISAGASVIQVYTAFIYHGPPIINKIKSELDDILKKNGFNKVKQAVGAQHRNL